MGKVATSPKGVGKVATSPLPPRGSCPLQSTGQNQKCRLITPAASGIPAASERGDPLRFKAGGQRGEVAIKGEVMATSPLQPRGSPPLQNGWQNQKGP